MKAYNSAERFIDYTSQKFGVRVRKASCRAIVLENSAWEEYDNEIPLPLTVEMLDPSEDLVLGDLPETVREFELYSAGPAGVGKHELRDLLLGKIDLETAFGGNPEALKK